MGKLLGSKKKPRGTFLKAACCSCVPSKTETICTNLDMRQRTTPQVDRHLNQNNTMEKNNERHTCTPDIAFTTVDFPCAT
jgi:hypothetical protein